MIEIDENEKKENDKIPYKLAMKYKFVTSMIVVKKNKNIFEEKDNEFGKFNEKTMNLNSIKLVTIGDSNCGKTSLILRFVDDIFNNEINDKITMNINCKNKKLKINNNYFDVSFGQ